MLGWPCLALLKEEPQDEEPERGGAAGGRGGEGLGGGGGGSVEPGERDGVRVRYFPSFTTAIKERDHMTRSIRGYGLSITTSSGTAACAACKFLRRKCTQQCLFAPHFPPDQPQKFANVHKIFGVSNITKLLHDLPNEQREDAVNSLAYEADARVKDPVYGCVGAISVLQQQVAHLQAELAIAHAELTRLRAAAATAAAAGSVGTTRGTSSRSNNEQMNGLATSTDNPFSTSDVHFLLRSSLGHPATA